MLISVVNRSKRYSDAEVLQAIRAINRQIKEDFEPYWSLGATLRLEGAVGNRADTAKLSDMRGDAVLYLADKADIADALGYHESNFRGIPFGFVFTDLCRQMKESWTVTLSHEALELIGDAQGNLLVQGPHPAHPQQQVFHWFEMCDAVQSLSYKIDDVEVSDFVLPLYFTPGEQEGGRNDFLGTRGLKSFGVATGGYVGFYDPKTSLHDTYAAPEDKQAQQRIALKNKLKVGRGYVRKRSEATTTREAAHAQAIDPIRHIVVLMLENRSFDHMLGDATKLYSDLAGIPQTGPKYSNAGKDGTPYSQHGRKRGDNTPYPADFDLPHEFDDVKVQLGTADNPMSGFIQAFQASAPGKKYSDMADEVMVYYEMGDTPEQDSLPALHALARNFLICDHWFSAMPGPTWPNRFFMHSGTCLGRVDMPSRDNLKPLWPPYDQDTLYDRLSDADKKWRIYHDGVPQSIVMKHMWLQYGISLITDRYAAMDDFEEDAQDEANFPEYVFIEPNYGFFGEIGNDQHPPSDVLRGDALISRVYNTLRKNEDLWNSTLLIVTYDEHGGFYDHVPPPATVAPDNNNPQDFLRLGVRVPTLLVSPWVDKGVCSTIFDHTSVLRYACDKWNMPQLSARALPSAGDCQANSLLPEMVKRSSPRDDTPSTIPMVSAAATSTRGRMAAKAPALTLPQGNTQPMQGANEAMMSFLASLPDATATALHAAKQTKAPAPLKLGDAELRKQAQARFGKLLPPQPHKRTRIPARKARGRKAGT